MKVVSFTIAGNGYNYLNATPRANYEHSLICGACMYRFLYIIEYYHHYIVNDQEIKKLPSLGRLQLVHIVCM